MLIIRILLYILIVGAIINGWWFVALPLLMFGIWLFYFTIETLIAGIMFDALYGMVPGMGVMGYIGTIIGTIIVVVQYTTKSVVR